jgi:hypothetical protein
MISTDAHIAGLVPWNLDEHTPRIHLFPNAVSVIAVVGQQDAGLRQIFGHDQIASRHPDV